MTENKPTYNNEHLSSDYLLKYHRHLLDEKDTLLIRKHLESCELCTDALGGVAEMHDAMAIYNVTHDLKKRLKLRSPSRKKIFTRTEILMILLTLFVLGLIILVAVLYFLLADSSVS